MDTVRSLKAIVEWRISSAQERIRFYQKRRNDLAQYSALHETMNKLAETEHRLEKLDQEYTRLRMVEALLEMLISCRSLRVCIATLTLAFGARLSSEQFRLSMLEERLVTSDSEGDDAVTVTEETLVPVSEGDDAVTVTEETLVPVCRPVFGMERSRHPLERGRHPLERSRERSRHPLERRSRHPLERSRHRVKTGRSKVRKKPATGSSSSSRGSRRGRKNAKNEGSTAEAIKKPAARDACNQTKRQALTELPAKAGTMAATRKPLVQATGSSTGGGSGNGSGGVHSTAVAADVKTMPLPSTGTPSRTQSPSIGTPQSPPFPKSWNT